MVTDCNAALWACCRGQDGQDGQDDKQNQRKCNLYSSSETVGCATGVWARPTSVPHSICWLFKHSLATVHSLGFKIFLDHFRYYRFFRISTPATSWLSLLPDGAHHLSSSQPRWSDLHGVIYSLTANAPCKLRHQWIWATVLSNGSELKSIHGARLSCLPGSFSTPNFLPHNPNSRLD